MPTPRCTRRMKVSSPKPCAECAAYLERIAQLEEALRPLSDAWEGYLESNDGAVSVAISTRDAQRAHAALHPEPEFDENLGDA